MRKGLMGRDGGSAASATATATEPRSCSQVSASASAPVSGCGWPLHISGAALAIPAKAHWYAACSACHPAMGSSVCNHSCTGNLLAHCGRGPSQPASSLLPPRCDPGSCAHCTARSTAARARGRASWRGTPSSSSATHITPLQAKWCGPLLAPARVAVSALGRDGKGWHNWAG